jgi:methyl-accepting chemotaxis protein
VPILKPAFVTFIHKILVPVALIFGIVGTIIHTSVIIAIETTFFTLFYLFYLFDNHNNKKCKEVTNVEKKEFEEFKSYLTNLETHLDSSVRNKMQIIPVLTEQLQAVIKQTDDAAGSLTEAFIGISQKAKKQMKEVQNLFGNLSQKTSGDNILLQTQDNLKEIQVNFSTLTSYFDKSINLISDIVGQLKKVDTFASNIEDIAGTTNILALNASIEAARSGEAGQGFKVIATEIKSLSKNSNDSIQEIKEITSMLTAKVNAVKKELESVRSHAHNVGARTDELFNQTTSNIGSTLQDTAERIKSVADDAEGLSKEISKAVVSIQFQDITRQRIEHVITPLATLSSEVIDTIDMIIEKDADLTNSSQYNITETLLNQYTMESEREILKKYTAN